ncbi:required for drug-induced death protein 1 [Columba livia]|uniref:required for drug-induced death protein 1 n=1 Tax=Columba livia TaxID=8932 RepID=UPI0031BAFC77
MLFTRGCRQEHLSYRDHQGVWPFFWTGKQRDLPNALLARSAAWDAGDGAIAVFRWGHGAEAEAAGAQCGGCVPLSHRRRQREFPHSRAKAKHVPGSPCNSAAKRDTVFRPRAAAGPGVPVPSAAVPPALARLPRAGFRGHNPQDSGDRGASSRRRPAPRRGQWPPPATPVARRRRPEVRADRPAPGGIMTVGARLGAKVRGRYSRRGPGDDQVSILPGEEEEEAAAAAAAAAGGSAGAPQPAAPEEEGAASRKVRFALLPGSYEPLRPPRAPSKRPYGKRLKKYGKNVGKALQKGCRYLVVGLQGLAAAYSAPFGVATQVASAMR